MNTSTSEFASASLTAGQLNAIVKKLGGYEEALKFLRGEFAISEPAARWREENGIIYFSVTSDGTSGKKWIDRLERKGIPIDELAKSILNEEYMCSKFKSTSGVTTEIAVLKSKLFGVDYSAYTREISEKAEKWGFVEPNAEIACLILDKFSGEEFEDMG